MKQSLDTLIQNPHVWQKFERAQRNMMRLFRGARHRNTNRLKYWARQMSKWGGTTEDGNEW